MSVCGAQPATAQQPAGDDHGPSRGAYRMVVIGDIHIYRATYNPLRLFNKRMAAQVNAWFNPGRKFDESLLDPTLERAASLGADMLLMTGDLTTSAIEPEFKRVWRSVQRVREALGEAAVVALPGNHDRYTPGSLRSRTMERCLPGWVPDAFPQMRPLAGPWHLLLIDAARPVMTSSRGRLGAAQLMKVQQRLDELPADAGLVIASHYPWAAPPRETTSWQHDLADATQLHEMLRQFARPVVFLHGHVHRPWRWRPQEEGLRHVLNVNVGAPTRTGAEYPHGQGFWQLDLPADAADPVTLTRHQLGGPPGTPHDAAVWAATPVEPA